MGFQGPVVVVVPARARPAAISTRPISGSLARRGRPPASQRDRRGRGTQIVGGRRLLLGRSIDGPASGLDSERARQCVTRELRLVGQRAREAREAGEAIELGRRRAAKNAPRSLCTLSKGTLWRQSRLGLAQQAVPDRWCASGVCVCMCVRPFWGREKNVPVCERKIGAAPLLQCDILMMSDSKRAPMCHRGAACALVLNQNKTK